MTWRAILLGLLSGVLIAGFGYLNDSIFRLNFIVGNHFPISVFGALVCVALGLNPVLRRLRPGLAFRPAELVLIVAWPWPRGRWWLCSRTWGWTGPSPCSWSA